MVSDVIASNPSTTGANPGSSSLRRDRASTTGARASYRLNAQAGAAIPRTAANSVAAIAPETPKPAASRIATATTLKSGEMPMATASARKRCNPWARPQSAGVSTAGAASAAVSSTAARLSISSQSARNGLAIEQDGRERQAREAGDPDGSPGEGRDAGDSAGRGVRGDAAGDDHLHSPERQRDQPRERDQRRDVAVGDGAERSRGDEVERVVADVRGGDAQEDDRPGMEPGHLRGRDRVGLGDRRDEPGAFAQRLGRGRSIASLSMPRPPAPSSAAFMPSIAAERTGVRARVRQFRANAAAERA